VALGISIPALFLATRLGTDFMPELDEGALLLQTVLPPEASLEEVDRRNHRVEDILRSLPDVVEVVRRTGRAGSAGSDRMISVPGQVASVQPKGRTSSSRPSSPAGRASSTTSMPPWRTATCRSRSRRSW